ncbi:MAG: threonine synthase [Gemmatimonadales bacterium]|nr:threonine synthase [Gemmatimonadales bacterium]
MACGDRLGELDPRPRCDCGGLLDVIHAAPPSTGSELRQLLDARRTDFQAPASSGVWRFRDLVLPSAGLEVLSHPEGNTPLLERESISHWAKVARLVLKHEGHNPTGSFKDRGMTVGITQARRIDPRAVACASTGNTAASLAAYAAQAAIPCLVLVPQGQIAGGKLAQALAYGATTLLVRDGFDRCLALIDQAAAELGVYLLNSINPFRIEGQKTIVFELLQQLAWSPPDWLVVPAGNLGNTAAFGKALEEAIAWGLIERRPRIASVQAEGAAPFAQSFRDGFATRHEVVPDTIASAIRIGNPASYDRAVRAIRDTDGVVTTVSDEEILEAKAVIDVAGIGCEPASAASVAGVRRLVRDGVIGFDQRVVAVLTGHILKDPELLLAYHQTSEPVPPKANRPIEIDGDLGQLARVLQRLET